MPIVNNPGRLVGLMLLAQGVCGALMLGVLLKPALAAPGFLVNAAPHATYVSLAALVGLVGGALSVGVVVVAWPVLRAASRGAALWLFALAAANLALAAVENVGLLAMLSLSQEYARVGVASATQFDLAAVVVRSLRYWAHYMKLIVGVVMMGVLFATLLRQALLPRALAAVALAATALQLVVVTLPVFGWKMNFAYLAPAGVMFLVVAVWLSWRGFSSAQVGPAAS
jgi:hypothetical protein